MVNATLSAGLLSQLEIDNDTTGFTERLRSESAEDIFSALTELPANNTSPITRTAAAVIARQLVADAIQLLVNLFITGLLRFARSDKLDNFFTIATPPSFYRGCIKGQPPAV
jgi:hypothetical protein